LSLERWFALMVIGALALVFLFKSDLLVDDANTFKADHVTRSFESSLRLMRTAWFAAGRPRQLSGFGGQHSQQITLNDKGWPVSVTAPVASSLVTDIGCTEVFHSLLQDFEAGQLSNAQQQQKTETSANSVRPMLRVIGMGTVCIYQVGDAQQDSFSILFNTDSGEVRMTRHQYGK